MGSIEKLLVKSTTKHTLKSDNCNSQCSGISELYEVSESAVALIEDEEHDKSWGIKNVTTTMPAKRTAGNILMDECSPTSFRTFTEQIDNISSQSRIKKAKKIVKRKLNHFNDDEIHLDKKLKTEICPKDQIINLCKTSNHLQKQKIMEKCKSEIKPEVGNLYLRKQQTISRIPMEVITCGQHPKKYSAVQLLEIGLKNELIDVNSTNANSFQFVADDFSEDEIKLFSTGLHIGSESFLFFNENCKAGLKEISQCFLASPGVDPRLVPDNWLDNHYRWIVWKLASMEKSFPTVFGGRCLTPKNVVEQLKYRYDREIDLAERSAFKKILEGDESASRLFICCVATIRENASEISEINFELEITDGWYSMWTTVDKEMITLIKKGVVQIGTKLAVMGAELISPDKQSDPLNVQVGMCCCLNISTNSCRRVRWNTKLGFLNRYRLSLFKMNSILPYGGKVGNTSALIVRVYPLLHMTKDSDGKTVFRNERAESVEEAKSERLTSEKAEALYEEIWKEVEQKYKKSINVRNYTAKDIQSIFEPDILFSLIEHSGEHSLQDLMNDMQLKLAADYREQLTLKIREEVHAAVKSKLNEILPERKVTKLLKVRLIDCEKDSQAVLTIWHCTEEIFYLFKENRHINFFNLVATGVRDKVLQLTNTRQTRYKIINNCGCNKFLRRETSFSELKPLGLSKPAELLSGEIDIVGIVTYIKPPDRPKGLTVVYLTNLKEEYIAISFWTVLSVFGCESILTENALVCCYNLQWRNGSGAWRIPNVFASELSFFSLVPKLPHLKQTFTSFKEFLVSEESHKLMDEHKERLLQFLKKQEFTVYGNSPKVRTPINRNENDKSICLSEGQNDLTPVQKKIRRLSRYGRAPPLSPLPLFAKTPDVHNSFKSPCRNSISLVNSSSSLDTP